MLNFLPKNKIKDYSAKALSRIEDENLMPTPQAYEVFYCYYSEENPGVTRSLDIFEKKQKPISQEIINNIYREYLSQEKTNDKIKKAGEQIQSTIGEVSNVVDGVQSATTQYGSSVGGLSGSLDKGMTIDQIEGIINSIQSGTSDMLHKNEELEAELSRSAKIMSELRKDLEAVRKEAMTDALTGLSNRKAFDRKLKDIYDYAKKDGTVFSLVLLDIDHFKTFNDDFGHQVGDQVLRLVARTLTNGVKGRDVACRYGGEEFAIIFPETEAVHAMKIANDLREAISQKDIVNRQSGQKLARITFSAGVAEFDGEEEIENLILRADRALYAAKNGGRNKVQKADNAAIAADESFKA